MTTHTPAQCGDTDLHPPHDACPGLDGTEHAAVERAAAVLDRVLTDLRETR